MISDKERSREARRFGGHHRAYVLGSSFKVFAALAVMFSSFRGWLKVLFHHVGPFTLPAKDVNFQSRWVGFTFKRIKKVGNHYAYGWVRTDKRIARTAV